MKSTPELQETLVAEFIRVKTDHVKALQARAARAILGASVMRVFAAETNDDVRPLLEQLPLQELTALKGELDYKVWFDAKTQLVANKLLIRNADNDRVNPGLRWGHATKILALFIRDMVLSSRLFSDAEAKRIAPWLYTPIDSIAMERMRRLGADLGFSLIKDIDTHDKFYGVQNALGDAARKVGVPRVWFDDNWGDRQ
jgi:hypothetical protein